MAIPTWVTTSVILLTCLIVTNVPLLYMDSMRPKQTFCGIMVVILTVAATFAHYLMVARPLRRLTRVLQHVMSQHIALVRALDDTSSTQPLVINEATFAVTKRMQQQLLDNIEVSSIHLEIYTLQARVKDLSLQYVRAQQHRLQDRLLGVTDSAAALEDLANAPSAGKSALSGKSAGAPNRELDDELASCTSVSPREVELPLPVAAAAVSMLPAGSSSSGHAFVKSTDPSRHNSMDLAESSTGVRVADVVPGLVRHASARAVVVSRVPLAPDYPFAVVRGDRFPGDSDNISLVIERSKNRNIVVYEGRVEMPLDLRHVAAINFTAPLDAYWLDIDPAYQERNRLKGKLDDREELNFVERRMAYGIEVAPSTAEKDVFVVRFAALKSKPMVLRLKKVKVVTNVQRAGAVGSAAGDLTPTELAQLPCATVRPLPVLIAYINNEECVAERIYIKSREPRHIWNLPTVELCELHGIEIKTGRRVVERVA